jgi:hypothetical protein
VLREPGDAAGDASKCRAAGEGSLAKWQRGRKRSDARVGIRLMDVAQGLLIDGRVGQQGWRVEMFKSFEKTGIGLDFSIFKYKKSQIAYFLFCFAKKCLILFFRFSVIRTFTNLYHPIDSMIEGI